MHHRRSSVAACTAFPVRVSSHQRVLFVFGRVSRGGFSAFARGNVGDEFDEWQFIDGGEFGLRESGGGGDGGDVDDGGADADGLE